MAGQESPPERRKRRWFGMAGVLAGSDLRLWCRRAFFIADHCTSCGHRSVFWHYIQSPDRSSPSPLSIQHTGEGFGSYFQRLDYTLPFTIFAASRLSPGMLCTQNPLRYALPVPPLAGPVAPHLRHGGADHALSFVLIRIGATHSAVVRRQSLGKGSFKWLLTLPAKTWRPVAPTV